jgi:hypothetical protein
MDSVYVLKRLGDLESALNSTPCGFSSEETRLILKRAERLLHQSYMLKGVQSLIKSIIRSAGDKNSLFNHLVQLNLVYHLLEVKNRALGVERRVRPDSNKRVDIVVFGQRDFYIELKNVNEPELSALKEGFAERIRLPLSELKFPYFVHFRFLRSEPQGLSWETSGPLIQWIKEGLEGGGWHALNQNGSGQGWMPYPSQEAVLSISLERAALPNCKLGRYGYGKDWPYCLYSEEYLEKELEKERKVLERPSLREESRLLHERNLRLYQLLRANSPFLVELELKQSVLRGIRDSELKFPAPTVNVLNVLLLHFGGQRPESMADTITSDLARWYYSLPEGRDEDRWWEYYGLWAEEEGFKKEGKIDAFVSLVGRGIEEPFQWKVIHAQRGRVELEGLLS